MVRQLAAGRVPQEADPRPHIRFNCRTCERLRACHPGTRKCTMSHRLRLAETCYNGVKRGLPFLLLKLLSCDRGAQALEEAATGRCSVGNGCRRCHCMPSPWP